MLHAGWMANLSVTLQCWTVVERRSLAGKLSLSCDRLLLTVTIYVDKPSANVCFLNVLHSLRNKTIIIGQRTRPTQPFIPSMFIDE